MDYCIKKPVIKGKRVKEVGIIIRIPDKQCTDAERDYMRARYIAKLLEWTQREIDEKEAKNT